MTLKVFTAFSGYDSQCLALNRLGIPYELVGWSEIDPYAIQAHNALFPQYADRNYGDIAQINWDNVPDFDLFTYSSPCQDFSSAGLQRGGSEGSGTRSSLLWECERAIQAKRPKYLLFENVKALVSKRFLSTFQEWQSRLESLGYSNFAKVLNAKDYGVPQNRERIFMVSILRDEPCMVTPSFTFPKPIPLTTSISDLLEQCADNKYYLSDASVTRFLETMHSYELVDIPDASTCEDPIVPINTRGGVSGKKAVTRTIVAGYHKSSVSNFFRTDGHGATAVMEMPKP